MPNFDPILTQKLLGTPFAGVGTTLERNSLQTLMKGLISENKYSVEYIINLCVSYGYSRQLAKEVFTELTGLSPELIVENNEYYQNPVFVPSGTIAWGLSKTNDKIAFYVVPFEYGYALNKKNETEVPEQIAQFVDINSAVKKMKGFVKKVFTIDQIITENLLLNEPIQSSAKNTHDTEEPYFSDPVRNLKNRYKKRYITDGEVKSEAFKLVASEEITEKEAVELAKWVDLEQEKRDIEEDEDVEFSSVKNDPKGRLQEEAQEGSRLKASVDEETAKCFICEETYPISEMKQEEDVGWMCDHCIKAMKSQGYELKLKASSNGNLEEPIEAVNRLYQLLLGFSKEEVLGHSEFKGKQLSSKIDDSNFKYTYITQEQWDETPSDYKLIDDGIKYMMFPVGSGENSGKLCPVKIKQASKKIKSNNKDIIVIDTGSGYLQVFENGDAYDYGGYSVGEQLYEFSINDEDRKNGKATLDVDDLLNNKFYGIIFKDFDKLEWFVQNIKDSNSKEEIKRLLTKEAKTIYSSKKVTAENEFEKAFENDLIIDDENDNAWFPGYEEHKFKIEPSYKKMKEKALKIWKQIHSSKKVTSSKISDKMKERLTFGYFSPEREKSLPNFNSTEELESYIKQTNSFPDNFFYKGGLFTMDEYDMSGSTISYSSPEIDMGLWVDTPDNRYDHKGDYKNMEISIEEENGPLYRNDITYYLPKSVYDSIYGNKTASKKQASKKVTAEEITLFFNNNYNRPITKKEDIEKILEGTGVELEIAEDGQRSLKYNGKEYYLFNEDKLLKEGNELYIIKPAYLGNMKRKVTASIKRKADEFKLEDIKVEEQKSALEKAEEEVNEANVEEFLNETTPQEYFDDEIQKDKIDNLNEKVSKIIDEFSARFDDFDKYDVSLQSYKIQMISDDKLSTTEVVEDLELNAKALIMIVLNINPKEDTTNVKKGLAIFSVNNDKTYWSGTFKTEDNKFYAFTEEGLDTLFRDLDTSMEITEDFVGNKKTNL